MKIYENRRIPAVIHTSTIGYHPAVSDFNIPICNKKDFDPTSIPIQTMAIISLKTVCIFERKKYNTHINKSGSNNP